MSLFFVITYGLWILSEVLLNRFMRSHAADKKNADKHSLTLIWVTIFISTAAAIYFPMKYDLPVSKNSSIAYAGIFLIWLGMVLRLSIIKSLGKAFTVDVTIRQNQILKTDGFYKYLRHPSYFASLISFFGFALSLNNLLSLFVVILPIFISFLYRIRVEEKVLIENFGAAYLEYKRSTKGLIPFLY